MNVYMKSSANFRNCTLIANMEFTDVQFKFF